MLRILKWVRPTHFVGSYPSRQRCFAATAARSAETISTTASGQAGPQEVPCNGSCQRRYESCNGSCQRRYETCNGSCQRRYASTDSVRQARPEEVSTDSVRQAGRKESPNSDQAADGHDHQWWHPERIFRRRKSASSNSSASPLFVVRKCSHRV